jgi:hypothetical protein
MAPRLCMRTGEKMMCDDDRDHDHVVHEEKNQGRGAIRAIKHFLMIFLLLCVV